MRKTVLAFALLMCISPLAQAQENKLYDTFKAVVDATDPAIEQGWFWNDTDLDSAESFTGLSGAIYSYDQHEKNVASLRAGVALESNHMIYVTAQANAINIASLYLPDDVKEALSPGFLEQTWTFLGKYGRAGVGPGWNTETEQIGLVATLGGTFNF